MADKKYDRDILIPEVMEDRLTALSESEMEMFRLLVDRPGGMFLSAETDIMLAELLAADELLIMLPENKAVIPADIGNAYREMWSDELTLKWRKRNWMYKCLETGKYLYGVMTWDVLRDLFALRYPHADMKEIRTLFDTPPSYNQWFTERGGRLVLNGYEQDNYYEYLETRIQGDVPFYIPKKEEVEELYERGSLISREAHTALRDFIVKTYGCDADTADLKVHDLYEAVNNHVRVNDAAEMFASGGAGGRDDFAFPSDEIHVRFIELYMEMSRECRVRDNRGHDSYEMVAIMAEKNRSETGSDVKKAAPVKRVKIGRNDPCPCGSGKKYKNCCGRN